MVNYNTNWMGPIAIQWYSERGLTRKRTHILGRDSLVDNKKRGDVVEYEDIIEYWSGGRIDYWGKDTNGEMALPVMHSEDYLMFSVWLRSFKTDFAWTLEQLLEQYHKTHPPIRWAQEVFKQSS